MDQFTISIESPNRIGLKSMQEIVQSSLSDLKLDAHEGSVEKKGEHGFLEDINLLELVISGTVGVSITELVNRIKRSLKKEDKLIIKEREQKREVEIIDTSNGAKITIREVVSEKESKR